MGSKTICFECRSYAAGNCNNLHKHMIADCGSALRLPRKTAISKWRELYAVFQARKTEDYPNHMRCFGQHNFRSRSSTKTGLPMKFKEKAMLDKLKRG